MKLTKKQAIIKEKEIQDINDKCKELDNLVANKAISCGISSLIIILLIVLDGYVNNGLGNLSYLWVLLLGINIERAYKWMLVLKSSHY
jgi:hypothetical protein